MGLTERLSKMVSLPCKARGASLSEWVTGQKGLGVMDGGGARGRAAVRQVFAVLTLYLKGHDPNGSDQTDGLESLIGMLSAE